MRLEDLLKAGRESLEGFSETAWLDACVLLEFISGLRRTEILTQGAMEMSADKEQAYKQAILRRKAQEPVGYIRGFKEFYSLVFKVSPAVLIPRPETELLVDLALKWLSAKKLKRAEIVDLGTGSGCIAITLAHELRKQGLDFSLYAGDISLEALTVAKENAARHKLLEAVTFVQGDWLKPFAGRSFDLVLSNPPYVDDSLSDLPAVLKYEPRGALFTPQHGLASLSELLSAVPKHLKPGGAFFFEFGTGQEDKIAELAKYSGWAKPKWHVDLSGQGRVGELGLA